MKRFSLTSLPVIATLILTPAIQAQEDTESGNVDIEVEVTATMKTFDELSSGEQVIGRALMDAQVLPAEETAQAWTLDDIAAVRSETGWGQVFDRMQAEGRIEARNLGQVVSQYQHNNTTTIAAADSASTATVAAMNARGKKIAAQHAVDAGNGTVGLGVTSGHDIAVNASMANGNAFGHQKNQPVSASQTVHIDAGISSAVTSAISSNAGGKGHGNAYGLGE
jgi:hypothetical protein